MANTNTNIEHEIEVTRIDGGRLVIRSNEITEIDTLANGTFISLLGGVSHVVRDSPKSLYRKLSCQPTKTL